MTVVNSPFSKIPFTPVHSHAFSNLSTLESVFKKVRFQIHPVFTGPYCGNFMPDWEEVTMKYFELLLQPEKNICISTKLLETDKIIELDFLGG